MDGELNLWTDGTMNDNVIKSPLIEDGRSNELQSSLNVYLDWCINRKMKINPDKCQAVIFQKRRLSIPDEVLTDTE